MQKLLIAYKVPPYFLDALYAFGAKITGDDDPHFNLCKNNPLSLDGKVDNESYGKPVTICRTFLPLNVSRNLLPASSV